jgi:hypothetical protein
LEKKRSLLVSELLTNIVEVRDILDIYLSTTRYSIDFLPIILEDVCKLVLRAGNIASRADKIFTAILQVA